MWDRPEALTALANLLYGLAAVAVMLIIVLVTVHLPAFPVREVRVVGEVHHVTRAQIEQVVRGQLRGNFFTIRLDDSREAFEKLPWVRRVNVRRQWPDRLEVALEEHEVLARWGEQGLVNTHGEVFEAASDAVLPVFRGPKDTSSDVTSHYLQFRGLLEPLGQRVIDVNLSDRRAWRLRLAGGMTLELGRDQVVPRLQKFAGAWHSSIALMREPPAYVDLRYPNGFAVRLKDLKWTAAKA
ncbi:MAG: cell division protein FtsQ/DivIB [Burkholderiales bacterium]|nr:cell division protein FtsQ/DivIB [Burkholderiales bacterium]